MSTQLSSIVKLLRANAFSDLDAFVVTFALLGWAKLSREHSLPPESSLQRIFEGGLDVQTIVSSAAAKGGDGLLTDLIKLQGMNGNELHTLASLAQELAQEKNLADLSVAEFFPSDRSAPLSIPTEVVALMTLLGQLLPGETVYTPWDIYAQLAIAAHRLGAIPTIETPVHSNVPRLLQLLANASSTVRYADPVLAPSLTATGKLIKFDVALSFPPMGSKYERHVSERDPWRRFPEHTTSGAVLAIRHLLTQAKKRVIVLVPNSLLSNSGSEADLRRDLVERGQVEAVIALPKGLIEGTGVATALLILDPLGGHEWVRFIDVYASPFYLSTSKTRWRLTDPEELTLKALASDERDSGWLVTISRHEVLGNEATLQVNRYVMNRASASPDLRPTVQPRLQLGELVNTIRSLHPTVRKDVPPSAHATTLHEVGAIDMPPHGYITKPGRTISIDESTLSAAAPLFLKPLDIILIVKGSVGKVGIVPHHAPAPGPRGWIVGQSGIVLRVNDPQRLDPRALFLMLRSPQGQLQLRGIVAGSTTPLIQLRELLGLSWEIPSRAQQAEAVQVLDVETQIQEQIDQLRALQAEAAAHLWSSERGQGQR